MSALRDRECGGGEPAFVEDEAVEAGFRTRGAIAPTAGPPKSTSLTENSATAMQARQPASLSRQRRSPVNR